MNIDQIAQDISSLVKKKNADYNNSFFKTLNRYGVNAYLIRINDKLTRLENLEKNKGLISDENIIDTLQDIAGYTLLLINFLQEK